MPGIKGLFHRRPKPKEGTRPSSDSKPSPALSSISDHEDRVRNPKAEINTGHEIFPVNQTMFQGFEWYCPADRQHWKRLAEALPSLASLGITNIWIPPATKTAWRNDNGYATYDLYDLGEFEQKGSRSTKWGSKEDLVGFVKVASSYGVSVIFDAVLNHKGGADYTEAVKAVKVDPEGI